MLTVPDYTPAEPGAPPPPMSEFQLQASSVESKPALMIAGQRVTKNMLIVAGVAAVLLLAAVGALSGNSGGDDGASGSPTPAPKGGGDSRIDQSPPPPTSVFGNATTPLSAPRSVDGGAGAGADRARARVRFTAEEEQLVVRLFLELRFFERRPRPWKLMLETAQARHPGVLAHSRTPMDLKDKARLLGLLTTSHGSVDDLEDISQLEASIEQSASVLIFLSKGYFFSRVTLRGAIEYSRCPHRAG